MGFKIADAYVQISQKGAKATTSAIARVGQSVKRMGAFAAVGATAAGTALFGLAKSSASTGDNIHKMALRTGASTEALSELAFAAEQSGSDIDTVERGFKGMARTLLNAERGLSTSTDVLSMLGLSIQQLQGLKPEDQFSLIAQKISEVPDATQRAALSMQIFGKAGADLGPLLQEGAGGIAKLRAEASSLGRTITQEEANNAAAFTDSLNRLQSGFASATRNLGSAILPTLTKITDAAAFTFKNFGTLWGIAQEHATVFFANVLVQAETFASNAVTAVTWFADNWKDVMATIGNATTTVFTNLVNNATAVVQRGQNKIAEYILRTQAYLTGMSRQALQDQLDTLNEMQGKPVEFKGLLDGFQSAIKEMPDFKEAFTVESTPRLDQLKKDLQIAMDEQFSIPDVAKSVIDNATDTQAADSSGASTQSKQSSVSDAASLVSSIQQSALSKQQDLQKKANSLLGDLKQAITQDGIKVQAVGPATAG